MARPPALPTPAPAAEWVHVDQLHGWAQNPRTNAAAVAPVVASIRRFGFGAPLLARTEHGA